MLPQPPASCGTPIGVAVGGIGAIGQLAHVVGADGLLARAVGGDRQEHGYRVVVVRGEVDHPPYIMLLPGVMRRALVMVPLFAVNAPGP